MAISRRAPIGKHGVPVCLVSAMALAGACAVDGSAEKTVGSGGSASPGGSAGVDASGGTGNIVVGGSGGSGGQPAPVSWPYVDPSLPPGVKDQFGGPTAASGRPELVYPLAGSMHPMNLGDITLQWKQGSAANTVFRVQAASAGKSYDFYVPCVEAECMFAVPEQHWLNLGWEFKGADVTLTVAGTDGSGGPVATSAPTPISYSPDAVRGALYYWAAAERALKRTTFGSKKAVPFIVPNSPTNDYDCVACHSVSRDGKTIAFAVTPLSGENIAAIQTAPTEKPDQPYVRPAKGATPFPADLSQGNTQGPTNYFGHNVALSPDGAISAVNGIPPEAPNWPPYFELRDTRTGATLDKKPLGDPLFGAEKLPILPEWSPDGSQIAVALADATGDSETLGCVWTSETCRSSIAVLGYSGGTLGAPDILVPNSGDEYHFYPSWSPDGKYIAFVSARWDKTAAPNQKSISNPGAVLRLVPSSGGPHACPGPSCYELTKGMQYTAAQAASGAGKQSTWPKFAPFAQGANGELMFISFNTKIDYGFLAQDLTQLWMFAVDVSKLASGDPSLAPIWLPYQDFEDGSLTPYWTETLPCQADPGGGCSGCVAGEECIVNEQTNECHCGTIIK
jgi:hypothetical protein